MNPQATAPVPPGTDQQRIGGSTPALDETSNDHSTDAVERLWISGGDLPELRHDCRYIDVHRPPRGTTGDSCISRCGRRSWVHGCCGDSIGPAREDLEASPAPPSTSLLSPLSVRGVHRVRLGSLVSCTTTRSVFGGGRRLWGFLSRPTGERCDPRWRVRVFRVPCAAALAVVGTAPARGGASAVATGSHPRGETPVRNGNFPGSRENRPLLRHADDGWPHARALQDHQCSGWAV